MHPRPPQKGEIPSFLGGSNGFTSASRNSSSSSLGPFCLRSLRPQTPTPSSSSTSPSSSPRRSALRTDGTYAPPPTVGFLRTDPRQIQRPNRDWYAPPREDYADPMQGWKARHAEMRKVLGNIYNAHCGSDDAIKQGARQKVEAQEKKIKEMYEQCETTPMPAECDTYRLEHDIPYPMLISPKSTCEITKDEILRFMAYAMPFHEKVNLERRRTYEQDLFKAMKRRLEAELELWKGESIMHVVHRFYFMDQVIAWMRIEEVERCLVDAIKDVEHYMDLLECTEF